MSAVAKGPEDTGAIIAVIIVLRWIQLSQQPVAGKPAESA
jgi:hypothetical protein